MPYSLFCNRKLLTLAGKCKTNKHELHPLVGLLLYVNKCVKPATLFVNHIVITLCEAQNIILQWTWASPKIFNGIVLFNKPLQPPITNVFFNACLISMGGCGENQVCALPNNRVVGIHDCTIVHLEMLNILVALSIWSTSFHNKHVI